jgi:MATE family, multidrug efflux pump
MEDLTKGSISRHLMKTTSFMLVTMVFQTLYFLVDLYWVGRLGKEALAGVGIAGNLMFIVLAVTQMLGVGTTTLISHAAGRKDRDQAQTVFNQALILSAIISLIFLLLTLALRSWYITTLSADAMTARRATEYLNVFLFAMAFQYPLVVMGAALRGTGNFKPGMVVSTFSVIVNMVLAPFLMFGWVTGVPLGVAGTALASLIAVFVGTIWLTFYFIPVGSFLRLPTTARPQIGLWRRMLKIGLPAGTEFALVAVYLMIVYTVSRPFGADAQAGFGIGLRIVQAGFMPVVALGFAVAPVAGQNFGAREAHRVRETFQRAASMAAGIMLVFMIVCHLVAPAMVGFFSADAAVVAIGAEYLEIISWNFVASGVLFVNASIFQAMGNTIPPLLASFTRILLVAIPAFAVARLPGFQLRWIWYISVAAVTIQLAMNLVLLRREFRARLRFEPMPIRADAYARTS